MLKLKLASQGVDSQPYSESSSLSTLFNPSPATSAENPPERLAADGQTPATANGANGANGVQGELSYTSTLKPNASKDNDPKKQNAQILKHLASQIPTSLAPFFQGSFLIFRVVS